MLLESKVFKHKRIIGKKNIFLAIFLFVIFLNGYSEIKLDSAKILLDSAISSTSIENQITLSQKSLLYCKNKSDDTLIIGDIYNFMATAYRQLGIIDKSLSLYMKSLDLYQKTNNRDGSSNVINNLGVIYGSRGQYELALEHFKAAIKIKQQLLNSVKDSDKIMIYLSGSFNNIGLIHDLIGQNDSALYYFNKSLQIRINLKDYKGIADLYSNIGILYLNMNENTISEHYLLKSFIVADSIADIEIYENSAYNLSEFYFLQGNISNAEKYINYCCERSNMLESSDLRISIFNLKSKICLSKKDYKNAYLFQEKYMILKDSLVNKETESHIAQLQISYEVQKKEERIEFLKKENIAEIEQNIFKSKMLLVLYTFLLITLVIAIIIFLQKKKLTFSNKELVKRNLEILSIDINTVNKPVKLEKKYSSSSLSDDKKQKILSELDNLINNEKFFLKTDLTIDVLSNKLSISRTYLSQIVNETFESSFTVYINKQRLNYSMKLLTDPSNDKYSVAGIAEMSGFKSISSFNTLFKQKTGITPSVFRKMAYKK